MDKKLENLWLLMDEFDFQFDRKFPVDLICVLCRKILVDARVSSCGCRFCKKCIEQYLTKDDLACPGHSEETEEQEMLNMERNVSVDHVANRAMAKLRMKCPIEMCSHMDQMINLSDHVYLCRKLAVKCPYSHVGCNYISLDGVTISNHVDKVKDGHMKLMMSIIEDLRTKIETVESENKSMMQESTSTQTLVDEMQARLDEKDIELNRRISEIGQLNEARGQWEGRQKEVEELRYQLGVFLEVNVREFTWRIDNYAQMKWSTYNVFDPSIANKLLEIEPHNKKPTKRNNLKFSTWVFDASLDKPGETDHVQENLPKFENNVVYSPLRIYSNEFSIDPDGSKMQLYSYYDQSAYHVCPKIVTGSRNPYRPWPIKCNITLGIMDGTNEQYFLSMNKTFEYMGLDEPSGSFEFADSLMDNITTKDITVKCIVKVLY